MDRLRNLIYTQLDPLIQSDYCLLDIPDHKNIGDNLIWGGELAFLKRLPHKMTYSANWIYCQFNRINPNNLILLHGGGNFGDVWRHHQEFRLRVISEFKQSRIIIFPQTVFYKDQELLKRDAAVFSQHPDLTICARDEISYGILKTHFSSNHILMLPDMAFCLDFNQYISTVPTNRVLLLKRTDKEVNKTLDANGLLSEEDKQKTLEVKDWPNFNNSAFVENLTESIATLDIKLSKRLIKTPFISGFIDPRHGLKRRDAMQHYINKGIHFINRYDTVYTTRLHGYILSLLLNKRVYMLDNSYGKNSSFFRTWMQGFERSTFIGNASTQQVDILQTGNITATNH